MRLGLLLLLFLTPLPALAHPHVLIDSHIILLFEKGKVAALQMGWKFDPAFSSSLVQDFDSDKDGKLSPSEINTLEKEAFQDTRQYQYFTFANVKGTPVDWPQAADFKLLVHQDALLYAFRLNFPQPVDPRQDSLTLSTYEETFYIDIDIPNDAAVRLVGDGAEGCKAAIGQDRTNPLLNGVAFPKKVEIVCQ